MNHGECSRCKRPKRLIAKGLCPSCYSTLSRNPDAPLKPRLPCSKCGKPWERGFTRGVCRACTEAEMAEHVPLPQDFTARDELMMDVVVFHAGVWRIGRMISEPIEAEDGSISADVQVGAAVCPAMPIVPVLRDIWVAKGLA